MTNFQLIHNAAVTEGLFTAEEAQAYYEAGHSLPLHTYKEWQRMGYQVRKGEKAALTTQIWRHKGKKQEEAEQDNAEIEAGNRNYYMTKAFFFKWEQVDKLPAAGN